MATKNASAPVCTRKPTAKPTAAIRAVTKTLRARSAKVLPASTAERAIGSDRNRSRRNTSSMLGSRTASAAAVGAQVGGEDADGGGLAGAVGTEQPEHRARRHLEVDAVKGHDLAQPLGQALDDDGVVTHGGSGRPPGRSPRTGRSRARGPGPA